MGVTLVFISQIATARSTVVFSGDSCRLFNALWKLVGKVEMSQGLYCVYMACEEPAGYAGQVKELLTINELHTLLPGTCHI